MKKLLFIISAMAKRTRLYCFIALFLSIIFYNPCNAQLTINIRYSGENGSAREYVREMEESGIADRIRAVEGCLRYDYFFPADDPEGLLLIDEWVDQAALNRYHASPMMQEAAALREKYELGGRTVRRYQAITEPASHAVRPRTTKNDNNMNQALSPRRQGLAVMAALEAKGDQAGLEKAAAEALDNGLAEAERLRGALNAVLGDAHTPVQAVDFSVWPQGEPNTAYAQYFTGNSYLAPMEGGVANVTFEPGCRNNWHIHHRQVQVLICVAGRGWYQEWGKPAVQLVPGTIIEIPEGAKHWHGAAADSWMQHLTFHKDVLDGASNEWLEPVSDEQYQKVREPSMS